MTKIFQVDVVPGKRTIREAFRNHINHYTIHKHPDQCSVITCGGCFSTNGDRHCAFCWAVYKEELA